MKKFIKSISFLCLALVMLVPMFALAGCSKKWTVTVSIEAGQGVVMKKVKVDTDAKSYVGKNTVEEGSKFEYLVSPATGYEIEKILVNNEEIDILDKDGFYPCIESVEKNITIKVYFKVKKVQVIFACNNGNDIIKATRLDYGSTINLNDAKFGGENNDFWFYLVGTGSIFMSAKDEFENVLSVPELTLTIVSSKTRDELISSGVDITAIQAL